MSEISEMSENPDSDDNNSAAEDRHHRIEEIERLSLPRRGARRRSIYLGEKILCHIKIGGLEESAEIVDLSSGGLAVVEGSAGAGASLLVGQRISLVFEKGHSMGVNLPVLGTMRPAALIRSFGPPSPNGRRNRQGFPRPGSGTAHNCCRHPRQVQQGCALIWGPARQRSRSEHRF